jgi:hypothetical protein
MLRASFELKIDQTPDRINVERLKDLNHARRGRTIEKSLDGEDSTAERGKERLISVLW